MRKEIDWWTGFDRIQAAMDDDRGMFLLVPAPAGPANPMTVSWGQIGFVWSRPIFTVFVRESRYTHQCLLAADSFTINVPSAGSLSEELMLCGTRSGRDLDKLQACALEVAPGMRVSAPYLPACELHLECRTVGRHQLMLGEIVSREILDEHYPEGDPHLVVLGEILGTFVEETP